MLTNHENMVCAHEGEARSAVLEGQQEHLQSVYPCFMSVLDWLTSTLEVRPCAWTFGGCASWKEINLERARSTWKESNLEDVHPGKRSTRMPATAISA